MPELGGFNMPYPQAPQPNQGGLAGNPAQMIDMLGGLQRLQILQQQAPALEQQSAATLQGTQIDNQTRRMAQQNAARQMVSGYLGPKLSGYDNPNNNDVNAEVANASRLFPDIAAQYPRMINDLADTLRKGNVKQNAAALTNTLISPEVGTSGETVGYNPQTLQPTTGSRYQANVARAAPGGLVTTPPAGAAESTAQMTADRASEANYPMQMSALQKAYSLWKGMGPGVTAPGSAQRKQWEAAVYGLMPELVPADKQKEIANYQELDKYMHNIASQSQMQMGPQTNAGLMQASVGNPNTNVIDLAGGDLFKWLIGQRRMTHALYTEASANGSDPANYANNRNALSNSYDPHGFMFDLMDPKERNAYIDSARGNSIDWQNLNHSLNAGYAYSGMQRPPKKSQSVAGQ